MRKLILTLAVILLFILPCYAADYDAHKTVDELADVSGAITGSTLMPAQDMDDLDKIGSITIQQLWDKGTAGGDLTDFITQTNWSIFYSDGSGDVTELALGTANKFLGSDGTTTAPSFQALVDADIPASIDPDKIGTDGTSNDKIEAGNLNITSLDLTVTSAYILVGNVSNEAAPIALSGAATITNGGVLSPYQRIYVSSGANDLANYGFGYLIYATGTGIRTLPPVVAGMQLTVEMHTDTDVTLNPDNSGTEDTIRLNGETLVQGDAIMGTNYGECVVCSYYSANTWSCFTDAFVDVN